MSGSGNPGNIAGDDTSVPSIKEVDRAIVQRIHDGDVAAFASFFQTYYPAVVRALTRYGVGVDTAEDVAQDVFLQVWEERGSIDVDRSLRGFVYMLGRNKVLNLLKHEGRVQRYAATILTQHDTLLPHTAPSADEAVLADELTHLVATHVATLAPRQREIYYLSREEGLSANEIAEVLGIAAQTVYVQMGRIVRKLYPILEPWIKN